MTIKEIFDLAIQMGAAADFRGQEGVDKFLAKKNEKYKELSDKDKASFDEEALTNPYLDSRIYNIAEDKDVQKVMIGVDIGPAELLIAKELGDIDLVIAHHPLGKGLAHLADVMDLQCDVLNFYGVPINVAEGLMKPRISEVARGVNGVNHQRTVDAAQLLRINLINSHTPCDNLAAGFLRSLIAKENPETLGEIITLLQGLPEYKKAQEIGAGPTIFVGNKENRSGKIALTEITGGTEGSPKLYEKMVIAGIGTVIGMHISEAHKAEAESANLNVVIAGHMSSDSLGINIFADALERRGMTIIPCSGFTRFSRI
jgi:putative NIF3 family GTP cyclohydrolase 1 type 2